MAPGLRALAAQVWGPECRSQLPYNKLSMVLCASVILTLGAETGGLLGLDPGSRRENLPQKNNVENGRRPSMPVAFVRVHSCVHSTHILHTHMCTCMCTHTHTVWFLKNFKKEKLSSETLRLRTFCYWSTVWPILSNEGMAKERLVPLANQFILPMITW